VVYVNKLQNLPQAAITNAPVTTSTPLNWMDITKVIYILSVTVLSLRLIIIVARFVSRVRNKKRTIIDGVQIVEGDKTLNNGSFFNYIFLNNDELSADELHQIIAHEMLHVKLYHSVDRVLVKIAQVFLWFNPFVYLYARTIEENHEFEVDREVGNSTDRNKYAELLLHLSVASGGTLYHNFSMVPLKKRITMLFTKPTHYMKRVIYLLVVPVVLISCLAFAKLESDSANNKSVKAVVPKAVDIDTSKVKYRQKSKLTTEQRRKEDEAQAKSKIYMESAEGKEKLALAKSLQSKIMTVTVLSDFANTPNPFEKGKIIRDKNTGAEFLMPDAYGQSKQLNSALKIGDEIRVKVFAGAVRQNTPVVIMPAYVVKNGKEIFRLAEAGKIPEQPFLYEANKVRFADGQVTNITKYANGKWKTAVFERVNGYKFNLSFKPTAPDLNSIEDGDHVTLRFIHEVKTGAKTYKIADWVAISTDIKDYGTKNPDWFYKFYATTPTKTTDTGKVGSGKLRYKLYSANGLTYTSGAKNYSSAAKTYTSPAKIYTSAAKNYTSANKIYTSGAKTYTSAAKIYTSPVKTYTSAARTYTSGYGVESIYPDGKDTIGHGIKINGGGAATYNSSPINKASINGKEYTGNDVGKAINSINGVSQLTKKEIPPIVKARINGKEYVGADAEKALREVHTFIGQRFTITRAGTKATGDSVIIDVEAPKD